jgi:hypothetical protein
MAGILQFQRRALEKFVDQDSASTIVVGQGERCTLDGKDIFLLGVSIGIGTSSDLQGINIAVFSTQGPGTKVPLTMCSAAAILRVPLKGECPDDGVARMMIEELRIRRVKPGYSEFERTGRKESYVNLI